MLNIEVYALGSQLNPAAIIANALAAMRQDFLAHLQTSV